MSGTLPTPIKHVDPAKRLADLEMDIGVEIEASRAMDVALYLTAGDSLRMIRDEELYQLRGHRTFRAYLRRRWAMGEAEAEWIMGVTDKSRYIIRRVREMADTPSIRPVKNGDDCP